MDVSTAVSNIFSEFDELHMAAKAEQQQAIATLAQRRESVVSLMKNVVKPFADHVRVAAQKRDIAIDVDESRGNDPRQPRFAIRFTSYENRTPVVSAGPSITLIANAQCNHIDVTEEMGELDDISLDSKPRTYWVEMGQTDTLAKMTKSLEDWLRDALKLMAARK